VTLSSECSSSVKQHMYELVGKPTFSHTFDSMANFFFRLTNIFSIFMYAEYVDAQKFPVDFPESSLMAAT